MKTTKTLPQVKDFVTSGKCDSFDLFAERRKNKRTLVCLLNV